MNALRSVLLFVAYGIPLVFFLGLFLLGVAARLEREATETDLWNETSPEMRALIEERRRMDI